MGRGVPRWGSPGESFLALLVQEMVSKGRDIGAGSWRGRKYQAKEKSVWEDVSP